MGMMILSASFYCKLRLGISIAGVSPIRIQKTPQQNPIVIILAAVKPDVGGLLVRMVEEKPLSPGEKERRIRLVDQLTSLGFMLFLLLAALNSK